MVLPNRSLESTARDDKIKTTDRCTVTSVDPVELYVTFEIVLFFIILKRTIQVKV